MDGRRVERGTREPPLLIRRRIAGLRLQLDAGLAGQQPQRIRKFGAVAPHDVGEQIPALATSEAAKRVPIPEDEEGRRLLGMKRAQPLEVPARALQAHVTADEFGSCEPGFDLLNGRGHAASFRGVSACALDSSPWPPPERGSRV